jgi:hypothetical protein
VELIAPTFTDGTRQTYNSYWKLLVAPVRGTTVSTRSAMTAVSCSWPTLCPRPHNPVTPRRRQVSQHSNHRLGQTPQMTRKRRPRDPGVEGYGNAWPRGVTSGVMGNLADLVSVRSDPPHPQAVVTWWLTDLARQTARAATKRSGRRPRPHRSNRRSPRSHDGHVHDAAAPWPVLKAVVSFSRPSLGTILGPAGPLNRRAGPCGPALTCDSSVGLAGLEPATFGPPVS